VLTLFAPVGCTVALPSARVGELVTKSETVELGDAQSVNVDIQMAAGELAVSGGASELMKADFTYNVDELAPEVEYSGGTLTVRTPEAGIRLGSLGDLADYRYEWDLRFNDDVPMEMKVELAAGRADLELGDLSLTTLDVETGASEVTLDLTGTWHDDLDVNISSGVGEVTVRLPGSVCVRVGVEAGLGEVRTGGLTKDGNTYVNDACGESDVTLRIDISTGVGAVNLEMAE
jgi:hypothetical protein